MRKLQLPKSISAGLILSYQCSAECRHCMYACSPKWQGWIPENDLRELLRQLARTIQPSPYGPSGVTLNHGLHFSGGEPFLNFELLAKAVETAEELRIPSTFVETNCYWCTSDEVTRKKLKQLKQAGMKGIMISVNPYYLEYVPFERTESCIRVSQEIFGENVMVYQVNYYVAFKRMGIKGKISLEDYVSLATSDDLARRVEMFLMGRSAYKLKALYPKHTPECFFNEPCQPPPLRNWHNHFDNYGNCVPGYCGGISLGNWQNLDQLVSKGIDLDRHPILSFLVEGDFQGLFHFAKDLGYHELTEGYISKCHLCVDIRKHLSERDDFEELRPKEFYSYLE